MYLSMVCVVSGHVHAMVSDGSYHMVLQLNSLVSSAFATEPSHQPKWFLWNKKNPDFQLVSHMSIKDIF